MICHTPLKIVPKPTVRFFTALNALLNVFTKFVVNSLVIVFAPVNTLKKYLPNAITISVTDCIILPKNAETLASIFCPSALLLRYVYTLFKIKTIAANTAPNGVAINPIADLVIALKPFMDLVSGIPIPSIISVNCDIACLPLLASPLSQLPNLSPNIEKRSFSLPHAVLWFSNRCSISGVLFAKSVSFFWASSAHF